MMELPPQSTVQESSNAALLMFLAYTLIVFLLAWCAHRALAGKQFLGEYFLGSRSLGMIALALTFGATSASAGSFAGFPALIYTHGWVLALWISSYMIFPLCGLGLLGKRMNRVSRVAGAITVPEVLRERLDSRALALVSTILMAGLLTVYLIPQFKLASLIMGELLGGNPLYQRCALGLDRSIGWLLPASVGTEYVLGLLLFAVLVVAYTTFGGFKAVVWTDVLQGLVMVLGVLLMLVLALSQVGGLEEATRKIARMTPPLLGEVVFETPEDAPDQGYRIAADTWFTLPSQSSGNPRLLRTNQTVFIAPGARRSGSARVVEVTAPEEIADVLSRLQERPRLPDPVEVGELELRPYRRGHGETGVYLTAPGPSAQAVEGFLPLGIAFSFFVFWALSGTGQPGNMVRLMAFQKSVTLRRAIASLSLYFTLIYFPLVVIFCCARILVPALDQTPDRIMPVMAFHLTASAGAPWLAGLLIAAPFAAAMSTVDSFMLMISSSVVRDIYARNVNPEADERTIKRLSYGCTLVVGALATLGAVHPPQFLQYLIVFTGGGLSVAFLAPVSYALYWPRFNSAGGMASMLGGFLTYLSLYVAGFIVFGQTIPVRPLGLDPLIWGFGASLAFGWLVTRMTPPPPVELVWRFFADDEV